MILDFRTPRDVRPEGQGERSAPGDRTEPVGAEIIIFPGVRRERQAEGPKPRRKSRPKRDRLELPD
jgi:hypothetical protein